MPNDLSRRELFQIVAAAPAVATAVSAAPAPKAAAYQRKVFDERQWRTVSVLADLIIPADDRSGSATAAGVPEFIDDWLDFRTHQDGNDTFAAQILGGLAWLDQESARLFEGKPFASAAPAQHKQILDRIAWPARAAAEDQPWAAFFSKFRDLTVSGFFSSKMGVADLPYLGNTAVTDWKGCDPKIWAIVEQRMKTGHKGLGGDVPPGIL